MSLRDRRRALPGRRRASDDAEREILKELAEKEDFKMYDSREEVMALAEAEREEYLEKLSALREKAKPGIAERLKDSTPRVNVKDFVDHIDYMVKKIGIDHVGISSDFDGGGGVEGWDDASETFNVTLELVRRGYTQEQIEKIWSGNVMRVWREVERTPVDLVIVLPNRVHTFGHFVTGGPTRKPLDDILHIDRW